MDKAFVRYDSKGNIVSGSLILRDNKPTVGNWKEIDATICCNPAVTVSELLPESTSGYCIDNATFYCDGTSFMSIFIAGLSDVSANTVVAQLNSQYGFLGRWLIVSAPGDPVRLGLQMKYAIAKSVCSGVLTVAYSCGG